MRDSLVLKWGQRGSTQRESDISFQGGKPRLPIDIELPTCSICGSKQTFFFQVAFPDAHEWFGRSLAVFACTACAEQESLIPDMLQGQLFEADIPEKFLKEYQRNFRFLVFPTSSGFIRGEYEERVLYKPISMERVGDPGADGSKVGGYPTWLLEDETPRSYAGKYEMVFLLQLEAGLTFEISNAAPAQVVLGLDGRPRPSSKREYELFIGNAVYFFGVHGGEPLVYVITQI